MAEVIKIKDQCGICRDEAEVAAMTSDEIWGGIIMALFGDPYSKLSQCSFDA